MSLLGTTNLISISSLELWNNVNESKLNFYYHFEIHFRSQWPWPLTQGHQFQQDLSQCSKQLFNENCVQISTSVCLEFCSLTDWHTDRQTHIQTYCSENITSPRIRGSVKIHGREGKKGSKSSSQSSVLEARRVIVSRLPEVQLVGAKWRAFRAVLGEIFEAIVGVWCPIVTPS